MESHVYKTIGDCQIKADVHGNEAGVKKPAIIFLHAGALISGSRKAHPKIVNYLLSLGNVVVAADYRLAPATKLPKILEDVQDLFTWVREQAEAFSIDTDRIGVLGNSAGAYLALASGYLVAPPPKVIVSLYGYGAIDGDWYTEPDPFYCEQDEVTEKVARKSVGTQVISEQMPPSERFFFYVYCRQQGIWPREITGLKSDDYEQFCPIDNVTPDYPPTLLVHGDEDTDVPHEESVMMAEELTEFGIENELVTVCGRGHMFEEAGLDDPAVAGAFERIEHFLRENL